MSIEERTIKGLYDVPYFAFTDDNGFLKKPFDAGVFEAAGLDFTGRQMIVSRTAKRNTVRGLYVQTAPYTEGKLVAPLRGDAFWVAVDVRRGSPTFGQWDGARLSSEQNLAFFIAPGFAHGCLSLTDDVELLLLADRDHSDDHGVGIAWNDPEVGIDWPLLDSQPKVPDSHANHPSFKIFRDTVGGI